MLVHAHPDDEVASTGGVTHKYAQEGVETILVTCTNGEFGDGPKGVKPGEPGHDPEAVRRVRLLELQASCRALLVDKTELLGYHDSGMADWDRTSTANAFAGGDLEEEVARLGTLLQRHRPQVLVTYDESGGYGHPDHIRTHQVARESALRSGIPLKLYYAVFPKSLARRVLNQMREMGIEPGRLGEVDFDPDDPPFGVADELITTVVDVTEDVPAKLAAIRAHGSQTDNSFFADLPDQVAPLILGREHFIRAYDRTGASLPEVDLFAGLR
ncbi:MAG: PIG-L family deacetylase [Candidatus Dormibacteria bacterium]